MPDSTAPNSSVASVLSPPDSAENRRRRRWRMLKDRMATYGVALGGLSVILAIVLIFFYLLYVVLPLFSAAEVERSAEYALPGDGGPSLLLAMEEQAEIGFRLSTAGRAIFFNLTDGKPINEVTLELPPGAEISSFVAGEPGPARFALGLSDGSALIARHAYKVTYPNDQRLITPVLEYPLGEEPLEIDDDGEALTHIAFQDGEEEATVVAETADGRLLLTLFAKEESFSDDVPELEREQVLLSFAGQQDETAAIVQLLLDKEQRNLYVIRADGSLIHWDVSDKAEPHQMQKLNLVDAGLQVTYVQFLTGDVSLLVGDSSGRVVQWFEVRDERGNKTLTPIREFTEQSFAISGLASEFARKGFIAADTSGQIAIYHSTAQRLLLEQSVSDAAISGLAIAPRANAFLAEDTNGRLSFWRVHNEHPEISWSSLWGKVWYESYEKPVYAWQSSSASDDFEPKLSITPLVYGTIKAAFYAMLLAVPLAIFGAIYTAYFMAPKMRQIVKPSIETMEALPTVILGFLAGLWLAPLLEAHLPGIFSLLIVVPLGVLVFAFAWQQLPARFRHRIPEGWDAALLLPVVLILGAASFGMSETLEATFFSGDMRAWLHDELGVGFDQRNALVVGLAMGFAVIPTIFSITEDAVFSVPKHLSFGSLALGATPWQTLIRVVILTASPGIFSAVMIGMGRAVGETMIVLMATGNTPVMDFSIFEGMRTLSANIAVEMPEAEVDSTHYRVLFLAALVLFSFTFVFNTLAEIVRQRLRVKYSSL
ncbi:MAG: ABC transporter permease subunit [Gammaproteobacteria bacterium]|nr:ABC transporter permease subunit [Gammaproteobacteria bacterium]